LPGLEIIIFGILALIAVVAAVMMITTRNAVHSALFLVVVMASLSIFFLGLWAPFIAMVQVAVYAGAIMVLFLFVIMLLGAEKTGARMLRSWQTPLAVVLALLVVGLGAYLLLSSPAAAVADLPTSDITLGSAEAIGLALYSVWLFPFEAVSILLLVAMIGAVVMTRQETRQEARDERKKKSV
jgi:NADH-quinone oxidoreductase subunit J